MGESMATPGGWLRRMLLILGLVAGLYQLVANAAYLAEIMNVAPTGNFGMQLGACDPDRFCEVMAIPPGPASAAGMRAGDRLRFDRPLDALHQYYGAFLPGDRMGVTLRRDGPTRHVVLTAASSPRTNRAVQASDIIQIAIAILTVIAGVFVMMRAGSRLSVLLLGAGLVCIVADIPAIPFWSWHDAAVYQAFNAWVDVVAAAGPVLIFAFARAFRREASGRDGALGRWAVRGLAAATGAWTIAFEVLTQTGVIEAGDMQNAIWISVALACAGYALAMLTLALGWREAPRAERARYGYITPAVLLIATMQMLFWFPWAFGGSDPTKNPVVLAMDVLPLAGLLLLVYAVLRHRVIDVGFAVNRTLVYGMVSAVLLAAFGLIEWAVDHFVPIEGREKNALVDAAIAVGVFLTFHRVRDVVENGIEGLFFRRWQRAEADLRRFVREAAFITDAPALTRALTTALRQFGEGAQAAVYLQDGRGYARAVGEVDGVAGQLDTNLPALVRVRAELKPMEDYDGTSGAALIAPMINRNEMSGFVLFGQKPSGLDYRPDEIELIGWATRQVGLDLHALKVEQLETDKADLRNEISRLEARNQDLLLALGARAPA